VVGTWRRVCRLEGMDWEAAATAAAAREVVGWEAAAVRARVEVGWEAAAAVRARVVVGWEAGRGAEPHTNHHLREREGERLEV
jgi:hypothetical protein